MDTNYFMSFATGSPPLCIIRRFRDCPSPKIILRVGAHVINELIGRGKHNYLGVGGIAQNRCDCKMFIEGGMAGKHNYLGGRRVAQIHVVSYWLTGGGELEGELAGMGNFKLPKHIIH